jgi:hypothetical protein
MTLPFMRFCPGPSIVSNLPTMQIVQIHFDYNRYFVTIYDLEFFENSSKSYLLSLFC